MGNASNNLHSQTQCFRELFSWALGGLVGGGVKRREGRKYLIRWWWVVGEWVVGGVRWAVDDGWLVFGVIMVGWWVLGVSVVGGGWRVNGVVGGGWWGGGRACDRQHYPPTALPTGRPTHRPVARQTGRPAGRSNDRPNVERLFADALFGCGNGFPSPAVERGCEVSGRVTHTPVDRHLHPGCQSLSVRFWLKVYRVNAWWRREFWSA